MIENFRWHCFYMTILATFLATMMFSQAFELKDHIQRLHIIVGFFAIFSFISAIAIQFHNNVMKSIQELKNK